MHWQGWMIEDLLDMKHAEKETQEAGLWPQEEGHRPKMQRKDYLSATELLHLGGAEAVKCTFCKEVRAHYLDKCPVIPDMKTQLDIVRRNKLCYKCLGSKHDA